MLIAEAKLNKAKAIHNEFVVFRGDSLQRARDNIISSVVFKGNNSNGSVHTFDRYCVHEIQIWNLNRV